MNDLSTSGATVACPKCGFEQESDVECVGCGIIFAKYKPPVEIPEDVAHSENAKAEAAELAVSSRFVHMLSWLSLAMTATVLFLILNKALPLPSTPTRRRLHALPKKWLSFSSPCNPISGISQPLTKRNLISGSSRTSRSLQVTKRSWPAFLFQRGMRRP